MSQGLQYDVDGRIEMPQPFVAQQEGYDSPMEIQEFPSPTYPSGFLSPPAQDYPVLDGNVQASYVGGMMLGGHVLSDHQRLFKSDGLGMNVEAIELSEISHEPSDINRGMQLSLADATANSRIDTDSGGCCLCTIM